LTTLIVLRRTVGRSTDVVVHIDSLPITNIIIIHSRRLSLSLCRRCRCQIIINGMIIVINCNNVVFIICIRNTTCITSSIICLVLVTYVSAHVHAFCSTVG
jgi:hypothetical protein